jgi:hypothetical protein
VVFLGIERGWRRPSFSGNIKNPLDFLDQMNWSFPNGIDDQEETIYKTYSAEMDTYIVVGKDGRLVYISPVVGFDEGAIDVPTIAANIRKALTDFPTPVQRTTWSRIKVMWNN